MTKPPPLLLTAACVATLLASSAGAAGPIISEISADSDGALLDADGEASDWIEIQNAGAAAQSLEGWALTDEPGNLLKWRFPAVVLEPGSFLVVFASGKDRATAGAELHTSFKLDASGEYLALVEPDGAAIASELAPAFPPQRPGFSFGRGRKVLEPKLISAGSAARVLIPQNGALGVAWTGGSEPFDDSPAAGWTPGTLGVGYPGGAAEEPPVPIAYYSFDGSAADGSGNGNHAELRGGAAFSSDVPAKLGAGKSISLDGLDDYVSAPLDVSETAYTLSLWFKADAAGHGLFTVTDGDLGANGYDRLLYLNGGNLAARVWNNETITTAGKAYADRRWRHVAHVFGGWAGGQRIYVDGQLVASGAKAQSDFTWQQRINIGFSNDAGAAPFFDGLIDDVSVWDAALTEAQIRALAGGAHPMALAGYSPWIATDVQGLLMGVSSSAFVRAAFDLALPAGFDSLLLRVRYDDGFAAYLNGVEVARRNAPAALAFDSWAASDRPVGAAIRLEDVAEIDVAEAAGLLRTGRNVLAFQALNDRPDSPDFLLGAELLGAERSENRYLSPPTPGAPNSSGVIDFVAEPAFSAGRGLYSAPVSVEITTATPGALIYYTLNGSAPAPGNAAAILYAAPVRVARTTTLRAAAFKTDYQPTAVATQTYIFPVDVARQPSNPPGLPSTWAGGYPADYQVDPDVVNTALPGHGLEDALRSIPSLSLTADPEDLFGAARGIYYNPQGRGPSWERAATIELIRPDGSSAFEARCGIRMHGNSSRDHGFTPKHPIRLLFRAQYGQKKLKYRLFEDSDADSFDELLLRGCSTDSWPVVDGGSVLGVQRWAAVHATYLRDQWMRDAQIAMGRPSCHGTYVQLYLNGLYWGLYNLAERPVDSFCAAHLGGEKEEWDVLKDFAELDGGNLDAWNAMVSMASAGLGSDAAFQKIQGRNPDGTRNPAYPVYLDRENLTDYMILHIASGAEDWPHHNWWGARRRGAESTGFKFFVWDQEISNDSLVRTHTLFETRFQDPAPNASPSWLYGQCRANASFRRSFGDRVHELLFNDGLLSPSQSSARWLARQGEIDRAIVGESARWGDSKRALPYRREAEWLAEMTWMRDRYWPEVQPIAVERFRSVGLYPAPEAPRFLVNGRPQHGGDLRPSDLLSMAVPAGAPRRIEVPLVAADAPASALVPADDSLGSAWRSADYAEGSSGETWKTGENGVGYETSTGYESLIQIDVRAEMSGASGNNSVYVRLPFSIADPAAIDSLDGLKLKMLYDDGFAAYLNGVRVAEANAPAEGSLAWSSAATSAGVEANPSSPAIFDLEPFRGLLVPGRNLLAIHGLNSSTASSDMLVRPELVGEEIDEAAPSGTVYYTVDGKDPTDSAATLYSSPITLPHTTLLKTRSRDGAEWSALSRAIFTNPADLPLRITEVMYHPAAPPAGWPWDADELEFLEILNAGASPASLAGVRLEGGVELDLGASGLLALAPGERLLAVENVDAFIARYDVRGLKLAGEYRGKLSNEGESIALRGPIGETLVELRYDASWYPDTNGGGRSLVIRDAGAPPATWSLKESWKTGAFAGGSPGEPEPDESARGLELPGDSTQDGALDLADAISLLFRLFGASAPALPCQGASIAEGGNRVLLDSNGDAAVDLSDAVHVLAHLFLGGPPPALGAQCVLIEGCPSACRR